MNSSKLKGLFDEYASAVAFVAVKDEIGNESIGSAFHVGEGVFVTARHVVENKEILSVATTRNTKRRLLDIPGKFETVHQAGSGKLVKGPLFHPDKNVDVALIIVEAIDAPSIKLGAHLDDWIEDSLVLCPVLIMGYPPIPFSKEPILVAATGETNAVMDKYTGGHPHFILSTMARGGFSGGPVLAEFGSALGLITESLGRADQPAEIGYHAALTVEPIYVCMAHHKVMPAAIHQQWTYSASEESFWKHPQ